MGYMLMYSAMRTIYRKQVFAEISERPQRSQIAIKLPNSERSKLIKGKRCLEIKLNGQMFDVVKSKTEGNYTTYFCIRDIREELFTQKLNGIHNHSESSIPVKKTTRLILDNIIKTALISDKLETTGITGSIEYYSTETIDYSAPLLNIPVPPPQLNL